MMMIAQDDEEFLDEFCEESANDGGGKTEFFRNQGSAVINVK